MSLKSLLWSSPASKVDVPVARSVNIHHIECDIDYGATFSGGKITVEQSFALSVHEPS